MVSSTGGIPPSNKRKSQTLRWIRAMKEPKPLKPPTPPAGREKLGAFGEVVKGNNLAMIIPEFKKIGSGSGDISFKIDPETGGIRKMLKTTEGADVIYRVSRRSIMKMEMLPAFMKNEKLVAFFGGIMDHINEKASG